MKQKKIIIFLLLTVLFVALLAVGIYAIAGNDPQKNKELKKIERETELVASAVDGICPAELTPYDFNTFTLCLPPHSFDGSRIFSGSSFVIRNLSAFDASYPVEVVMSVDENRVIVPYRLSRNEKDVLLYLVFERTVGSAEMYGEDIEIYTCCGEYYFASLDWPSYDTFRHLEPGTALSEADGEALCVFAETGKIFTINENGDYIREEVCLMKEGILHLVLNYGDLSKGQNPASPQIKAVTFYEYGKEYPEAGFSSVFLSGYVPELP